MSDKGSGPGSRDANGSVARVASGVRALGPGRDACELSSSRVGDLVSLSSVEPPKDVWRESTPRDGRGTVSVSRTRGGSRRGKGAEGKGGGSGEEGRREAVAAAESLPPPPGLGPQSLTCGPAPSRAPPASGTPVAGRGGWANDFLLPAARPGSDSHASGRAPNTKGNLFAPHAPKQIRRGRGARGNSRDIWKALRLRSLVSASRYCAFSGLD